MTQAIDVERDDEGYLFDPENWTTGLAEAFAREEHIELIDEHWIVLRFVRDYYADHLITPDIRHAAAHLAQATGIDAKAAKRRIFELFPYGYVKQTCKIAGMKRPRAWSTG